MARSYLSNTLTLVIAVLIHLGAVATSRSAEPTTPAPVTPIPVTPTPANPEAAPRQSGYPEIKEALQLLSTPGGMSNAFKKLEDASRKYPELPSAHVMMYKILADRQPNAARFQLDEAIKANPSDPEPYLILGTIALQELRLPEAEMSFEKARQLLATYNGIPQRKLILEHETLSNTAKVAEIRQLWKEAEARLRDTLKIVPEDLTAHQRLARALFWQGKAKEAYDELKVAKEIDREYAKKSRTREVVLTPEAIMGKYYSEFEGPKSTKPQKWFDAAVQLAPKDLATRQFVAMWALENGKLDLAKEQAQAILKIEQSDSTKYSGSKVGHMLRGLVALWEKRWQEAEQDFAWVLLQDPSDFRARNNAALALVEQDDPAKKSRALAYAEANRREKKDSADAISTLIWVYLQRKEFDLAQLTIREYGRVAGGAADPDTLTYVAHYLEHDDKKFEAKEALEGLLKSGRPFSMRPEAQKLYERVKDAKKSEATPAEKTP